MRYFKIESEENVYDEFEFDPFVGLFILNDDSMKPLEPCVDRRANSKRASMNRIDRIPRYVPPEVLILGHGMQPVIGCMFYPANHTRPDDCPLVKNIGALELVTPHGTRWWGFEDGYINAELKMVVVGFPNKCEIRSKWKKVPVKRRISR